MDVLQPKVMRMCYEICNCSKNHEHIKFTGFERTRGAGLPTDMHIERIHQQSYIKSYIFEKVFIAMQAQLMRIKSSVRHFKVPTLDSKYSEELS